MAARGGGVLLILLLCGSAAAERDVVVVTESKVRFSPGFGDFSLTCTNCPSGGSYRRPVLDCAPYGAFMEIAHLLDCPSVIHWPVSELNCTLRGLDGWTCHDVPDTVASVKISWRSTGSWPSASACIEATQDWVGEKNGVQHLFDVCMEKELAATGERPWYGHVVDSMTFGDQKAKDAAIAKCNHQATRDAKAGREREKITNGV